MRQPKKSKKKKRLVDYLDYGTPEYAKAYKEGRIQGQELDEVVVTADKRTSKNILEDYPFYNSLNAQDKKYFRDSSPIGTQIRARATDGKGFNAKKASAFPLHLLEGAMSAAQVPQSAMVEGVEAMRGNEYDFKSTLPGNKQRIPEDAWGYENPEGFWQHALNMGMNVVADPLNVVGVGAAKSGLKQGLKKGTKAGVKKVTSSVDDVGKRLTQRPTGVDGTPDMDYNTFRNMNNSEKLKFIETVDNTIQKNGKRMLSELTSPEGKKRLIQQFKEINPKYTTEELEDLFTNRVNSVTLSVEDNRANWVKAWYNIKKDKGIDEAEGFLKKLNLNEYFPYQNAHYGHTSLFDRDLSHLVKNKKLTENTNKVDNAITLKKKSYDEFDPTPGYITLGKGYENSSQTLSHELGHAIQKGEKLPIDNELRNLISSSRLGKGSKVKGYIDDIWRDNFSKSKDLNQVQKNLNYFVKGSKGKEPYAFARELREDMLTKGKISDVFEPITASKLTNAKNAEEGITGNNRLIYMIPPWDRKKLAETLNRLPALIPAAIGTGAAMQNNKENMATKKKKYRTGSGTQGVVRNYLPDPLEANANAQIMMAKAEANAQSDPFAMGLDMMAMYSEQIGQGLGSIKGAYGLEGEEQINVEGNEIVDDPTMGAMEMLGPSHDEGGIDMDVSPETNVFSDKVIDPNGKTMAEKKKKREQAKKNLVKMLEEDSLDKPRRNAYERKLTQLEAEEEKDLTTQDQAGMFAELMGLPHTGEDGYAKYGMRKKMFTGKKGYTKEGEYVGYEIGDELSASFNKDSNFDLPFQIGDMVKLAGNLHGMTSQMGNVKDARAGDTAHPNHYKDVGKEAVATLEGSKGDLEAMKANQESRVRREAVGNRRRGRRSARGINQMRATDAVTDMQTNMAELDIFDNIASTHMGIDQTIAQTQMGASQAVARGAETARDLTDRDRHSYYSAKGRALGDVTKGLQQTGKDLNQMALNPVQMRLLEALGEHYTVDKKDNVTRRK